MTSLQFRNTWLGCCSVLMLLAAGGCPKPSFGLGEDVDGGAAGGTAGSSGRAGSAGSVGGTGGGAAGSGTGNGKACGSRGLQPCADAEYCSYPASASCGDTDAPGVCKVKPEACTEQYEPVCGCDGKTHGNACSAASAGVSVRYDGECKPSGGSQSCGGLTGKPCPGDQYCNYPPDAICGAADATGVCADKPQVCRDIFMPVCGCDGITYGNDCEAAAKGQSVVSEGACKDAGQICGGPISAGCPDDSYCKFPEVGQCGDENNETGVCEKKPDACTLELREVCGCDGTTYGNACAAAAAGVSIASEGACAAPGGVCGTRGAADCAADEYCDYPEGSACGAADEPGKCTPKPDICTTEFLEVCGCDGKTYGNKCSAAAAGTSVSSVGKCDGAGSGETCGGFAGIQCSSPAEFCNFPIATMCGSGDQSGTCTTKPTGCTKEYQPVCGCDGMTYGNACTAAAAGTSIISTGECADASGGDSCGGLLGATCPDTQYCNYPRDALCGAADAPGKCTDRPEACDAIYQPVCTCGGTTYGNACEAALKGESVVSDGPC